jgi:hydrogenase expression/formation protein HypE
MDMERIENSHGAGGKVMQRLLEEVIIPSFGNRRLGPIGLDEMDDGATLLSDQGNLIVCSDAHTVQPLNFPGGSIGTLTACGTVNDLAVMGAKPIAMTNTIIVEEGFEIQRLVQILKDLNHIIEPLGIAMIAGDTKVMPRGTIDQLVFSTTGIGVSYLEEPITDRGALPGDDVVVTGPIGDHGTTLLAHREGLEFNTDLISDVAPLWEPLRDCLDIGGIHSMKDPTRGGTSVALNEIASKSNVQIVIKDGEVPVRPAVRSLCEILGLDFFNMSCEGTAVIAVDSDKTDDLLDALYRHTATKGAKAIGKVEAGPARVILETGIGGRKVIQVPYGEPVPRVC